jgi:hypothetical protein
MRSSIIGSLILLALLGIGLRTWIDDAGPPKAQAQETQVRVNVNKPPQPEPAWSGGTVKSKVPHSRSDEAVDDALNVAIDKFTFEYLEKKLPGTAWRPNTDFARKYMLKSKREEVKKLESDPNAPDQYVAHIDVELTADGQKEMEKEAREMLIHLRMLVLGRILGGLVLVLGGVAAFIRVDEWTKGYLTVPLRLLMIALATAGIFALWLLA